MPKPDALGARVPYRPRRPRHRAAPQVPAAPARPALEAIRQEKDAIVEALILQARKGSYLHAKFLFDFAGLSHASDEEQAAHQQSLAELLLEKLELEPEE